MTNEERELARDLFERHRATFQALAEMLREDEDFPEELAQVLARDDENPRVALRVQCEGTTIEGAKVPEFLSNVVDFTFRIRPDDIPFWPLSRSTQAVSRFLPPGPMCAMTRRSILRRTPVVRRRSRLR